MIILLQKGFLPKVGITGAAISETMVVFFAVVYLVRSNWVEYIFIKIMNIFSLKPGGHWSERLS